MSEPTPAAIFAGWNTHGLGQQDHRTVYRWLRDENPDAWAADRAESRSWHAGTDRDTLSNGGHPTVDHADIDRARHPIGPPRTVGA